MTGTSEVTLENAIDAHIPYLEITGKTVQNGTPTPEAPVSIENANDNGMSVALHGKNLATAQQVCKGQGSYKEVEYKGRQCVSYIQNKNTQFVLEGGFKPNTQYTISFEGTSVGTDNTIGLYVVYEDGSISTISMGYTDFRRYVLVTKANNTIKGIGQLGYDYRRTIYIDVNTFMLQEGAITDPVYEPYFRETVEIPTSIDVDGTSVPLLFSEYDKLTVDRVNNKVIYTEGSFTYSYTGNEKGSGMQIANGNGLNYQSFLEDVSENGTGGFFDNVGYCSHFKKAGWNPLSAYGTYATRTYDVIFRTDGKQTLDEFKAFLKEQYENGTPVTVVNKRQKAREHDITKTELGQALLSLATRQGTNYLEIVGDHEPSALNVTYYSESEQDQVNLTIKYMCGDREIKDPRVQEVRKGSKYLIVAPHIDGYTRISSEVYGVADENVEIELIYEENSDATI
jgi:hypothetical protein